MQHSFVHRRSGQLGLVVGFVSLAAAFGCNSLTGAGDLKVVDKGASGTESQAAAGTASNGSVGGSGVGPGAGVGGATAGPSGVGPSSVGPSGVGPSGVGGSSVASTTTTSSSPTSASTTTNAAATTATTTTGTGMSMDPTQLCVDTINMFRSTRSLPPMTRWTSEETCVDGEAQTDGMMNSAHYDFIHGQTCGADAENECPGWSTNPLDSGDGIVGCLTQMWGEKDQAGCAGCDTCDFPYTGSGCTNCDFDGTTVCGHYLNMKSSVLSTVACGFWSGGWYTQNFM